MIGLLTTKHHPHPGDRGFAFWGFSAFRSYLKSEIKFLLPVRLSAQQATRYYARPYTALSEPDAKTFSLCGLAASGGVLNPRENKQPENAAFEIGTPGNDESGLHRLP